MTTKSQSKLASLDMRRHLYIGLPHRVKHGAHNPLPILARLIAKFQDEAENFSCGVGAGGYKSEDNPFGQDPAEEAYLQTKSKSSLPSGKSAQVKHGARLTEP